MPSHTTTSLLLPSYSGNFVAEVIGANPTATTFVLDCDFNKNEEDCYVTQQTVVVGPWADKSIAPGAATTGIYRESFVVEEEGYSFSAQCDMSRTYAKTCTTINVGATNRGRNDDGSPTATFPRSSGTAFDAFYYAAGYGAFYWIPVTVTAGQEHLRAAKTASSAEATSTGDTSIKSKVGRAIIANTETASTIDDDLVTITGEASPTVSSDDDDLVTITGEAGATTNTVNNDVVTITGEAAPTKTSGSTTYITRAFNVWAAVALTAFVALF
ncbi:uncharacterized protein FTOL_07005 [Fusarium torulosum]|uniref:Uncharacterized protein n=1 Tax=Fusarium torulosum TaxID=33205 RepID=A0AAE8MAD7_9HYPO|nr:uncharacterized protein FTOL_07005 [Fusarium torulosum]